MRIVEHHPYSLLFLTIITTMFALSRALKRCPDCGKTQVPYPLSTSPNCGDQSYKIRCTANTLFYDSINGSSYKITAINRTFQRLILQPPGFTNSTCLSADFQNGGMWLDANSPFNITSSNTAILMNCSQEVLINTLWNCSSSSICHKYIEGDAVAAEACGPHSHASKMLCCDLKTGGSSTAHRLRVRKERCSAYVSFPNLDPSLPVSKWMPGMEVEWELPREPPCNVPRDCFGLVNSGCSPDPATGGRGRKCLCMTGFQWDPINGICRSK